MKLIFIGMPGSGKGTQSERVAEELRLTHISTGDIFRDNIKEGTELGKKADALINKGRFVPDSITNKIVKYRLALPDCSGGFILDGYPRNMNQARFLEKISTIDFAVLIELEDEIAKNRIFGRYSCPSCGAKYNVFTGPKPKKLMICNVCKTTLSQRKDDDETSFWHRMEIYHRLTEPLVQYYEGLGKLIKVNGNQSVEDVQKELMEKLKRILMNKRA